eukprot:scaffold62677_cov18-Prasinocladus_malaysianus.AAC.1
MQPESSGKSTDALQTFAVSEALCPPMAFSTWKNQRVQMSKDYNMRMTSCLPFEHTKKLQPIL